jgi:hypothetical protein
MTDGTADIAVPADLLAVAIAKVRAYLDPSLPVKNRIRALWAGAKAARQFASFDVVRDEFAALAEETGLTRDLGRHGKEDVEHVVTWALRSWDALGGSNGRP